MRLCGEAPPGALVERVSGGAYSLLVGASLAVVFKRGDVARVFVMFDNNSHGEGRTADVSALFARMLLVDDVAYLVAIEGGHGFLEASARPVPAGRVMLNPARIGRASDVFESFVNGAHCG